MKDEEKMIVSKWVRLVNPDFKSIRTGINQIINNQNGLIYLEIIEKYRSMFCWDKRLDIYKKNKVSKTFLSFKYVHIDYKNFKCIIWL